MILTTCLVKRKLRLLEESHGKYIFSHAAASASDREKLHSANNIPIDNISRWLSCSDPMILVLGGLKFGRILLYYRMNARGSTYIVLFLVKDDFIEVQCGWHLRHLKRHLCRHSRGDEDAG
jgi:hypothetical protein